MRKSTRIVKRTLALFLVVLMSINTLGAVVSDNDGSAFITKAEFDSLKNDFQSQIDQYNTSIDSKIDGSIASYLAGINIEKVESVTPLCYFDGEHIISLRNNYADVNWVEGLLSIEMRIDYLTSSSNLKWNTGWIGVKAKDPIAFTELGVKNLSRDTATVDNTRAIWSGLTEKKYKMKLMGYNYNTSWAPGAVANKLYIGPGYGVYPMSNVENFFMVSEGTGAGHKQMLGPVYGTSKTNAWSYSEYINYDSVGEETISVAKKHLVVMKNNTCRRFTNYDGYTDWCYDKDGYGSSSIHTQWTDGSQLFADGYTCTMQYSVDSSGRSIQNITVDGGNTHTQAGKDGIYGTHRSLPWNGFVKELEDWNQIATTDYDTIAMRLKSKYNTNSYYEDNDRKLHLLICAGIPIYYNESKDDKDVAFEIEFVDKSKNYALFFKKGPFIRNTNPSADANITHNNVIKGSSKSDPTASAAAFTNSILCENGKQKYRITLEKGECLFMKWQFNDTSVTGGGELIPPSTIETYVN